MTTSRRIGLYLLALLSVGDLAGPLMTDGKNPPYAVAVAGSVLGAVSLLLIYRVLRDPTRPLRLLIGLRVLSAVSAAPAFVISDVPTGVRIIAGVIVAATAVAVALVASSRSTSTVTA